MTTKLQIYNTALRYCKDRSITLTENREPRRLLDSVWDNGGVDKCLEEAMWKFATRSVRLDYDPTVEPEFGHVRAFAKPDDWKITVAMCSDEYYDVPLTRYIHENNYWYADIDQIYVRFVSNDAAYGEDLSLWPASFADFVAAHFAKEIVNKLTGGNSETIAEVREIYRENKLTAKGKDAWNQAQAFPAPGNWSTSRGRYRGDTFDRGNRGSLLG